MNFLMLAVVMGLSSAVLADVKSVWIRASEADPLAFRAELSVQLKSQSYSDWWIRNRVSLKQQRQLERLLAEAQNEFLNGSLSAASQKFEDVIDLERAADWKSEQRQAFVYAHLRMAQMAANSDSKAHHVRQAARWGDIPIHQDLFPRSLLTDYQEALSKRVKNHLDLDLWFPQARYLLVDGLPIEVRAGAEVFEDDESHRFTVVYDHASVQTTELSWRELNQWNPKPEVLADGTCQSPRWIKRPEASSNLKVYFGNDCAKEWGQKDLASHRMEAKRVAIESPSLPLELPSAPKEKSSFKSGNKWLWAAAGVVALGVLISQQQKKDSEPTPTTTVGF